MILPIFAAQFGRYIGLGGPVEKRRCRARTPRPVGTSLARREREASWMGVNLVAVMRDPFLSRFAQRGMIHRPFEEAEKVAGRPKSSKRKVLEINRFYGNMN